MENDFFILYCGQKFLSIFFRKLRGVYNYVVPPAPTQPQRRKPQPMVAQPLGSQLMKLQSKGPQSVEFQSKTSIP